MLNHAGAPSILFTAAVEHHTNATRMMLQIRVLLLITIYFGLTLPLAAQTRFIHAYSGTSSAQLAIWAAKDLSIFTKYGLDADLVFILDSGRGMQALLGGGVTVDVNGTIKNC